MINTVVHSQNSHEVMWYVCETWTREASGFLRRMHKILRTSHAIISCVKVKNHFIMNCTIMSSISGYLYYFDIIQFMCTATAYEYVLLLCLHNSRDEALEAFAKFNGRWYGGRQLSCRFTCVTRWKMAICGDYLPVASYLAERTSLQSKVIIIHTRQWWLIMYCWPSVCVCVCVTFVSCSRKINMMMMMMMMCLCV